MLKGFYGSEKESFTSHRIAHKYFIFRAKIMRCVHNISVMLLFSHENSSIIAEIEVEWFMEGKQHIKKMSIIIIIYKEK